MKKLLLSTLLAACAVFCFAQSDTAQIRKNILRSADSMSTAFKSRNWRAVVRFSPKAVIDMGGGEDALVSMTETAMTAIPDSAVKQFYIGPVVQLVQTESDWQCVVEQHLQLVLQGMRITVMSPLIGQSLNGGASWTFFDSKGDEATAKTILPTLSPKIQLPKPIQNVEHL